VPRISAELPGSGERFQGLLPPLVAAPVIVIRKKAVRIFTLDEMVAQGVMSREAKEVLSEAVRARKNIIVAGGTDSGKTTFTNALLDVISGTEDRIVIIEDTPELQCGGKDIEYLRTRDGIASLRDLVRDTMRLSPDRIVIGEVRGAEALDLLKAWNTGHGGGVSTLHASSAVRALCRLEQLVQEAGVSYSKGLISEAVEIVVYMEKVGTRRVVREIVRLSGLVSGEYDISSLI
jgi:type IV secretion system protein TrbB